MDPAARQRPRYLILDVDDTFTVRGALHPDALEAVERAARAGIEVILNTGRPAGFGATLLTYVRGVSAVVVENGGAWIDRRRAPELAAGETPVEFLAVPASDLKTRLVALSKRVARRLGLSFTPTADSAFRLTDYTVLRALPGGDEGLALLRALHEVTAQESEGQGRLLTSSIHIHFMLDGTVSRSKADGVAAMLARRGLTDPHAELARWAVAVGDSPNDASFFEPGRFALSVGVRNIERFLPELGLLQPGYVTRAAEGLGLCELIEDLLAGKLGV